MPCTKYGFRPGQGLVTDMNAIRRDEELDNLHSIYVDQWDWEKVITAEERTLRLFAGHRARYCGCRLRDTADELRWKFPELKTIRLTRDVDLYHHPGAGGPVPGPDTPKSARTPLPREHGTVCIMQIGGQLKSGKPPRRPCPGLR